jgi:fatty acid/phospholipid biosynthesis enzyme
MTYKGRIGVDMTGGDVFKGKSVLDRTTQYVLQAAKKYPEYLFCIAGPKELANLNWPTNVYHIHAPQSHYFDIRKVTPEQNNQNTPLIQLLQTAEEEGLDAIVTHAKAKSIQQNTIKNPRDRQGIGLERITGLRRPALIALVPTIYEGKFVVMLDVGANYKNKNDELVQYAYLGSIIAEELFGTKNPKVNAYNICEESDFGPPQYQELYQLLERDSEINFTGFMEDRHAIGLVEHLYNAERIAIPDVLIAEGFVGNEFIKVLQTGARLVENVMKQEMFRNTIPGVSYLFNYIRAISFLPVKSRVSKRLKPDRFGGALFGGVKTRKSGDIVFIKGHGEADEGIFFGIERAIEYHEKQIMQRINEKMQRKLLASPATVKSRELEKLKKELRFLDVMPK